VLQDLTPANTLTRPISHMRGTQITNALLNGHPVAVDQAHRPWSATDDTLGAPSPTDKDEPVVLTVSAPVSLTLEDVVALLFDWRYLSYDDLADDDVVLALVADTVINQGCHRLEELRWRLREHTSLLTAEDAAYLAYCRHRATTLFGVQSSTSVC
jgi:hypothetical protein